MTPRIINDGLYGLQNGDTGTFLKCYTSNLGGDTKFIVTDPEESRNVLAYAFIVHVVQSSPLVITLKTAKSGENISCVTLGSVPKRDNRSDVQWTVRDGQFQDNFYLLESADGNHLWMGASGDHSLQGNIGDYKNNTSRLGAHLYWHFVPLPKEGNMLEERNDIYQRLRRAQFDF
ncbi:hypothetical protein G7Y89_g15273 [Cudoniella acicularis]|uniref:Uncharacterized protein n=1 Tax=Cudoniella acicularis TaxID=354080 RepID=A0A8H4QQP6_9HELO|nr:hypothetical protein G7Y89_g15273 [Cudoniella acicularis]